MWNIGTCSTKGRQATALAWLTVGLLINGCASNEAKPLPKFKTVSVQTITRPVDGFHLTAKSHLEIDPEFTKGTALAGGSVLVLGALFCSSVGSSGALACAGGAASGATHAAAKEVALSSVKAVDPLDQYTPETKQRAMEIFQEIDNKRDFFLEIQNAVTASIPKGRQAAADKAKALVSVGPRDIQLVQLDTSKLELQLIATLSVESNRNKRTPRTDKRNYVCTRPARPIDDWLLNDGKELESGISECISNVTRMMVRDLDRTIK